MLTQHTGASWKQVSEFNRWFFWEAANPSIRYPLIVTDNAIAVPIYFLIKTYLRENLRLLPQDKGIRTLFFYNYDDSFRSQFTKITTINNTRFSVKNLKKIHSK